MIRFRQTFALTAISSMFCLAEATDNAGDEELEEIIVVGRSIVTSSSRIEVEREILVDTATVLKDIPGANVNSNGQITGIAQYRGMYGDRVSVNVDGLGIVSGGPNAMDAPLSYVSPMITEELVVHRGIPRVSSATETIGGHVDTSLSRGEFGDAEFGLSGFVGARYSTNGDVGTTAGRLTLTNAEHRISLIGENDQGDDISTPEGRIRPSQLDRERYDVSYAFQRQDTNLLVFAGQLDTADTGTPALPMDIRFIETDMVGANFATLIGPGIFLHGHVGYNDVAHLMDNFSLRQAPLPAMYRQNLASGSGYNFNLSGRFELQGFDIRVGVDGVFAKHDSVITNPNNPMFRVDNFTNIDREVRGVFAEWQRVNNSNVFEFGVRYNRVEARAGLVGATGMMGMMATNVGNLAAAFNSANRDLRWNSVDAVAKYRKTLSDQTEWTLEIGTKSRAPAYQELFLWLPLQATGGLADGRTYIGNLALDSERCNEIVIGFSTNGTRYGLSPQVFFKRVQNYIQGAPSANALANSVSMMMTGAAPLQFQNVDAEIWGFDLAWRIELSDRLLLDGIGSYARGKRTDIVDDLYRLAPLNGSIGLTYHKDEWTIKAELVGYAKQNAVAAYNGEVETNGYWLTGLAGTWNPLPELRFEARIDNLWDESYQDHLAGVNRAAGSDIPVGDRLYGPERTISAGIIYSF